MEKSALEVVDSSPENVECIKRALAYLPDRARWHSTPGLGSRMRLSSISWGKLVMSHTRKPNRTFNIVKSET
jgi:hypothetical protein